MRFRMPKLPQLPELSKESLDAVNAVVRAAARKASPLSWSIAVVIAATGAFLLFNCDMILKITETVFEVKHMRAAHEHCEHELAGLKNTVNALQISDTTLKQEVQRLKDRQANN